MATRLNTAASVLLCKRAQPLLTDKTPKAGVGRSMCASQLVYDPSLQQIPQSNWH